MIHTRIRPVRLRSHDHELGVDVSRVVGYRKVTGDGWKGPVRRTVAAARQDEAERAEG